jgi:hypothetical protein
MMWMTLLVYDYIIPGESNNVEVYLWSISRWHHRSCDDVPVAD